MKKFIIPALALALAITSCKTDSEKQDDIDATVETEETSFSSIDEQPDVDDTQNDTPSVNNWDSVIDEYEAFMDDYIAAMEKAKNGDTSAALEYQELMEKAESLESKLKNAESELTPAQMQRFMQLQTKISNAAVQMMQ